MGSVSVYLLLIYLLIMFALTHTYLFWLYSFELLCLTVILYDIVKVLQ